MWDSAIIQTKHFKHLFTRFDYHLRKLFNLFCETILSETVVGSSNVSWIHFGRICCHSQWILFYLLRLDCCPTQNFTLFCFVRLGCHSEHTKLILIFKLDCRLIIFFNHFQLAFVQENLKWLYLVKLGYHSVMILGYHLRKRKLNSFSQTLLSFTKIFIWFHLLGLDWHLVRLGCLLTSYQLILFCKTQLLFKNYFQLTRLVCLTRNIIILFCKDCPSFRMKF